jgi:hypothetical protein
MRLKRILAAAALTIVTLLTIPTGFAGVDVGVSVGTIPPPPQVVPGAVGIAPGPGYVWTNGYWDWSGGAWALPPHGSHVWVEPYYHPYQGHYHYHRGHWR